MLPFLLPEFCWEGDLIDCDFLGKEKSCSNNEEVI